MSYSPQSALRIGPGHIVEVDDPQSSISSGVSGAQIRYWKRKRGEETKDNGLVWRNSGPVVTEAKSLFHHLLDELKHPFRRYQ